MKHFIYREIEEFIFKRLSPQWQQRVLLIQLCLFALVIILLIAFMVSQVRKNIARQKAGEDITDPSLNNKKYLVDLPVFQKMNRRYERNLEAHEKLAAPFLSGLFEDTMLSKNSLAMQLTETDVSAGRPVSGSDYNMDFSYSRSEDPFIPQDYGPPSKRQFLNVFTAYAMQTGMGGRRLEKGRALIMSADFEITRELCDNYYKWLYYYYTEVRGRIQADLIKKNYEKASGRSLDIDTEAEYNNTQPGRSVNPPVFGGKSDPWQRNKEKDPWD